MNLLIKYLTRSEKKMLNQRAKIHQWMLKGYGVREIARLEKVSTTTVVNIKKYLGLRIRNLRKDCPGVIQGRSLIKSKLTVPWKIG